MTNRGIGAVLALAMLAACSGPEAAPTTPDDAPRVPIVQLFEWRWDDVAAECETFLGPAGYRAVQVSSPAENAVVPGRPWWERYQPVSYTLDNRSGDRAAFADMVQRCADAGVEIHVDAVLNHMTGVYEGVGTAGSVFGEYDYPGLWGYDDFHHCGLAPGDDIADFGDVEQVRRCELVNLADLATEEPHVQDTLSSYLNDLVGLGVTGFRLDAARHMAPEDLQGIFARVEGAPFVYQEVTGAVEHGPGYFGTGLVTLFTYGHLVADAFRTGDLRALHGDDAVWDQVATVPSGRALVFLDNHDTQRSEPDQILTYRDGTLYDLGTAFMLAYPYGTPRVMSSYAFDERDQPPPMEEGSEALRRVHRPDGTVDCGQGRWVCEHRRPAVAGMVGFRNAVEGAPVAHWWTGTPGQAAFARDGRGFVAFNRDADAPLEATLQTGLAPGTYCDVFGGGGGPDGCTGAAVVVGEDGTAQVTVPPMAAVAVHVGDRSRIDG